MLRKTQALTGFWSLLALGQNPCGFRITRKGIRAHTKYLGGHHEQAELAKLNGKHKEELEAVRKEQGRKLEAELKAKDEEIAGSKKRLEEALTQSTKELSATKKSLDTEKSKNAEMATLGKATYAMDQLLKSYEELMDIVASVGSFDKVAANKMMIEISKSMATVEKKCKKKLTA